tara:strand:+ start:1133 stop:1339 length:207 start_codon:yes stop_codon:yes gene_type:complete
MLLYLSFLLLRQVYFLSNLVNGVIQLCEIPQVHCFKFAPVYSSLSAIEVYPVKDFFNHHLATGLRGRG